uniref:Uncharacterized protein n=1 Tax=Avena sativa TaxID=4498 RepID=A0ACD5ZYG1_AVESA
MDYSTPLSLFDRATYDLFVPVVFVFPAPTPSNEALKEGLHRAVAAYPQLAGRLVMDMDQHQHGHGRRSIHVNNQGVLVLEAAASVDLANVDFVVDGRVVANIDAMYPGLPQPEETLGSAVLQIKLTRYCCGGLVVGLAFHHQVLDGTALDGFLTTWSRAVRQGTDFTAPTPLLDRAIFSLELGLLAHTDTVTDRVPLFDHGSTEFNASGDDHVGICRDMKTVMVSFTPEFIAELRARVGETCTRFQCLLAHMWKKTTQARGLSPEEFTQVRVAVNCRGRARPTVPSDYLGNMVLWAFPRLQARDVLSSTYRRVVSVIRQAVARVDAEYIQSFLDYGAAADARGQDLRATAPPYGAMCGPDIEVDSWLSFGYHRLDFGGGPQSLLLVPDMPAEGIMVFMPCVRNKGGVDVLIALEEEHVTTFLKICHSLDAVVAEV